MMLATFTMTPELNTKCIKSLHFLEEHFLSHKESLENWFEEEWQRTPPPIYGSVDLRNAGFKLAPIDMNLFPAGFNNLNPDYLSVSIVAAKKTIDRIAHQVKNILLIPEGHTRNLFYWQNIKTLKKILTEAGFVVRLGLFGDEAQTITLAGGEPIVVEPLQREGNKLGVENFNADLILLNNDLSAGIPDLLTNLSQPLVPPAELGWSQRLKSEHFHNYAEVADEFAEYIKFDPWLIAPLFRHCGKVNFMQQDGLDCVTNHAKFLFAEIKKKYAEYHIPYQPFLVVKADAGTYGMAVMTVRNIDELTSLNRKQRAKMASTKGGQQVNRVIIQEGVYTFETVGDPKSVAEPVVYMFGKQVVGGFYRVHKDRGNDENLNAPGMHFEPLAFAQTCHEPCNKKNNNKLVGQNRFYVYGVVARLSMLAAAREMKDQVNK